MSAIDASGRRGWGLVLLVSVFALLATWLVSFIRLGESPDQLATRAEARVYSVEREVQQALITHIGEMESLASSLAQRTDLVAALSGTVRDTETVVRIAAGMRHDPLDGFEIHDVIPSLLAWSGPRLPMDDGPERKDFLDVPVHSVARDGGIRTALVVWIPVLDGARVVGVVRWLRLVENRVPLRNEFLRDWTWSEEWSRNTGLDVSFRFGVDAVSGGTSIAAPSGVVLGRVHVQTPGFDELKEERNALLRQIRAFWWVFSGLVLLVAWCRWVLGIPAERMTRRRATAALMGSALLVAGLRFHWLWLDAPAVWQQGKAPMAPLFDPQHLATAAGAGLMRTTGDLVITVLLLCVLAWLVATVVFRAVQAPQRAVRPVKVFTVVLVHIVVAFSVGHVILQLVRWAILDSTLDYFARSGLVPDPLVVVVLASLLLLVAAAVVISARTMWMTAVWAGRPTLVVERPRDVLLWSVSGLVVGGLLYTFVDPTSAIALVLFVALSTAWAVLQPLSPLRPFPSAAMRIAVPALILCALVLYPMMDTGMQSRREYRMRDAANAFMEDLDARVLFAIGKVLERAEDVPSMSSRMDSTASALIDGSLAQSLGSHTVTVTIHDQEGRLVGRHTDLDRQMPWSVGRDPDPADFQVLRAMYVESGSSGMMIERLTDPRDQYRFVYVGMLPIADGEGTVVVRASPRPWTPGTMIPFPRVLVPAGYYGTQYADLSIAEFKDGVLVRTQGTAFGRAFLNPVVADALNLAPEVWTTEQIRDRSYNALYRDVAQESPGVSRTTIGVREPGITFFDHLYFLLRVIVSGLFVVGPVAILVFGLRLTGRRDRGQRRFRDRVLNAFFSVGIVTVAAMGFVGVRVVTGETDRAVETWLRQHLDRVENALLIAASPGEMPWQVLERIDVDSLAAQVGLDLNVYHNMRLERASRPELVRDRLIEQRLPIEAVAALQYDGFRFVTVEEQLGSFTYTAGYRSIPDERGRPHFVVGIPTLPEQDRLEEERARTLAYLFGALLLLVLVVLFTASILASALSRPIAQLQSGLRAVAAGHFERIGPLDTRDEISELVDSFNTMQDQLKESRSLLAQQERQLAWREMARQVAHEIKNPLTPMKLNIQHLQRAWSDDRQARGRFPALFQRTMSTMIEQIDSLARIADEFSSLGRMPTHLRETMDLNAVIREAADLMSHEDGVRIRLDLHPEPLLVVGDPEAVRRMYINFIKNAIQAVPEARPVRIGISSNRDSGDSARPIESTISDNGAGISPDVQDRVFMPSFSTKTSGSGLGLAIARRTIETMEGEIGFESTLGEGTVFWIRLPDADRVQGTSDGGIFHA
ncbi:MAG: ATP-binding protein [Rhodothermales bacterium]